MEWVERLNQSMNYIEEHLTGEIDYEQLGRIACCSAYHYQRMFTYMAGITLAEYIRRRKMSLAAVDLFVLLVCLRFLIRRSKAILWSYRKCGRTPL